MKLKLLLGSLLFSLCSWGQIYMDNFGTGAGITTKPYTGTPTIFDSNLSSFSWTTSAANFNALAGNGGGTSQSLSLNNSSGTPTMTLTFNVAAGYQMSVTQFDFWRVRSGTGAQNWSMIINGTAVGSGTTPATTGVALTPTNVTNAITNLTGTITVVLTMSGATGTGTFRLDDFTLYGSVTPLVVCSTPTNQASGLAVNSITSSSANFSWINAIATTGTVVVIRPTATSAVLPATLTTYTANANYAAAPETAAGSGNRVVYINTGTSAAIIGLGSNTQYTATIYAYNSPNCYNTTSPVSVNFTTLAGSCPPTGPLNGTYTIPSPCFLTIASAVTYLNTNGINGSVVFNVAAGYTETAPIGGFNLTATGTIVNKITFQKTAGVNPIITAYTPQTVGSVSDAVFKIVGGDYITIDGFTLREDNSNTTATLVLNNMTEFGIGIFYASTTNGAQNNTIKNCTIDLDRTYTNTFGIYSNSTHTSTNVETAGYASTAAGSNSNLTITGNTITDINVGIAVIGSNTATTFNNGLVIGGSSANANTVTNYGTAAPLSSFNLVSLTVNGILVRNTTNFTVSYNTITGSGVVQNSNHRGVYIDDYTAAPTGTIVNNINNNTINVTSVATTSVDVYGIACDGPFGNNVTMTSNINDNIITVAYPTANTGSLTYGINYGINSSNLNINDNTIAISTAATTGLNANIFVSGNISTTLNIDNNTIAATLTSNVNTNVVLRGIHCPAGATTCVTSISYNNFNSLAYTGSAIWTGAVSAIFHSGTPISGTINNNKFNNLSIKINGAISLINNPSNAPNLGNKTVIGNEIVAGFARTAGGNGYFYGYFDESDNPNTVTHTISGNNFSNISINPANRGMLVGIDCQSFDSSVTPTNTLHIEDNIISNCTNGTGEVCGIWADGCAGTSAISGNSISNLSNVGSGATPATALYGIRLDQTNPYIKVFNNTISQLEGLNTVPPTSTADVSGIYSDGGTNIQIYKNKIFGLKSRNTGEVSVFGIFSESAVSLTLYNNIIGDLTAINANSATSSPSIITNGIFIGGGISRNVYYNTVYLTGTSSGANFGSCAISFYNIGATTPTLDLRNNLLINTTTPKGTGKVTSLLFFSGTTSAINSSYSTSSNNNLFYSGTPSATNLITTEVNSVNSDQTLAGFQARIGAPRDSNSVTETSFNPVTYFESVTGSDTYYLKPKGPCVGTPAAFNAGTFVASVLTDFAPVTRNTVTPDIGAWELDIGKNWIGTFDSNWGKAENWSPSGVPTIADCVFIKSDATYPAKISGDDYKAYALNLTVEGGASLVIDTGTTPTKGNSLTVKDFVYVNPPNGSFVINNNSSLIQQTDVVTNNNFGNIIYNRNTASTVNGYDYVYWSSPVLGQSIDNFHASEGLKYFWNPTFSNSNGTKGNWVDATGSTMGVGRGYIIRANSISGWSGTVNGTFTGVPNNGTMSVGISRGALFPNEDDNWNLVGNPYPSAIDAKSFLTANTDIQGYVNLWRHTSAPTLDSSQSPFYDSFKYNYNNNDYIEYNGTGSTPPGFNGKIAAGQGFFVVMNDEALATSGTVTFNNTMRVGGDANSQFYKSSQVKKEESDEKNRIWLDLVDGNNQSEGALIGYVSGATLERDRLFDADASVYKDENSIYSLIEGDKMTIQGRPVPFNINDAVSIGVNIAKAGDYKIAINTVDGLFLNEGQNIYLEDKLLNIVYDLRKAPYEFTTKEGTFNDRFVLRYTSDALTNADFNSVANNLIVVTEHKQLLVTSSIKNISEVAVYDVLGRKLSDVNSIDMKQYSTSMFVGPQSLIVKIKLEDGTVATKKVIVY